MKIRVITFLILVVFITLTTSSVLFGMTSWLLSISLSVVASLIATIFSTYMANKIPNPKRLIANIQERFATKQASQSYRIILCDLDRLPCRPWAIINASTMNHPRESRQARNPLVPTNSLPHRQIM